MKEDKLIRGDAKLKKLPEDRQRAIWEKLNAPGETLASVCKWLAEDGVRVSRQTLSEFASWYSLKLTFEETEKDTLNFQEFVTQQMPELAQEKVTELGSVFFNLQAIKKRDPELFLAFQTAQHRAQMDHKRFEQRERELALAARKVSLLESREEKTKKVLGDEKLTLEQQNAKLRAVFGMA